MTAVLSLSSLLTLLYVLATAVVVGIIAAEIHQWRMKRVSRGASRSNALLSCIADPHLSHDPHDAGAWVARGLGSQSPQNE